MHHTCLMPTPFRNKKSTGSWLRLLWVHKPKGGRQVSDQSKSLGAGSVTLLVSTNTIAIDKHSPEVRNELTKFRAQIRTFIQLPESLLVNLLEHLTFGINKYILKTKVNRECVDIVYIQVLLRGSI